MIKTNISDSSNTEENEDSNITTDDNTTTVENEENDSTDENQTIEVISVDPIKLCKNSNVTLNFSKNFSNIESDDIIMSFTTDSGLINYTAISYLILNEINVTIPSDAISGEVILYIDKLNFNYTFNITLASGFDLDLSDYEEITTGNDKVNVKVENNKITTPRRNESVIYKFTVPANCIYDISVFAATAQSEAYINIDIDINITTLKRKGRNIYNTTKKVNSSSSSDYQQIDYGSFYLTENTTYYIRVLFLMNIFGYIANVNQINIFPCDTQNKSTLGMNYTIYEFDFKNDIYYPFYAQWAKTDNYINITNEFIEFHFDQASYDSHEGKREYKGAELTGNFKTFKDAWYGYKIYCPEDSFPKTINATIITQMFQKGDSKTWAGHMHINETKLILGYRSNAAASSQIDVTIGEIEWGTWNNVIIYYKVGKNNKGRIKVWFGTGELKEDEPTFDSGGINFGFGKWVDDETLDDVLSDDNPIPDYITCKFGLYNYYGGDRTIRFKNFKALEYNPDNAFDIIYPN